MKWLFVLILFANLAFWGYTRLEVPPSPLNLHRREINAAKLHIMPVQPVQSIQPVTARIVASTPPSAGANAPIGAVAATGVVSATPVLPGAVPTPATTAAGVPVPVASPAPSPVPGAAPSVTPTPVAQLGCFSWHGILADDLPNVRKKISALQLGGELHIQRPQTEGKIRFWVYIPPRDNAADAQKKADQIKRLGVSDYFVVHDGGQWQYAISLGLFASKDAAQRRLDAIKAMGVRTAVLHERDDGANGITIDLTQVPKRAKQELSRAATAFRGSAVVEDNCT